MKRLIWISLLLFFQTSLMAEEGMQNLIQMKADAEAFLHNNKAFVSEDREIQTELGALDKSLHLPQCAPDGLKFTLPEGEDPLQLRRLIAHCDGPSEWSVYFPLKIHVYAPVLVTKDLVLKGETLISHVYFKKMDLNQIRGHSYLQSMDKLNDLQAKRNLSPETVLSLDDCQAKILIKRGQNVLIKAQNHGLIITMPGVAQEDGHAHATIRVLNAQSHRLVQAKVFDEGSVEVTF